ncbi:hypothetical protein SDC9_120781 [bioreactor metagenome]|uniref:Uncharacterized protein n=1 Tax=bioreactor metagenome TaxID=1076179 RepID=A0A645CA45_9ZZZZ
MTADRIGAPRPRHHGGDPGAESLLKGTVSGVRPVDGPQVRRGGIGIFVSVISLKTERIFPHAQMGMRVDKAGQHIGKARIHRFTIFFLQIVHNAHIGNNALFDSDISVFNNTVFDRMNFPVYDQHAANPSRLMKHLIRLAWFYFYHDGFYKKKNGV